MRTQDIVYCFGENRNKNDITIIYLSKEGSSRCLDWLDEPDIADIEVDASIRLTEAAVSVETEW